MRVYSQTIVPSLFTSALLCFTYLLFSPGWSFAETRYVSDTLVLNLRDNIKAPFKVVGTVISNDVLVILEEKDDFLLVETSEGEKGWISAQYVKSSQPKSLIIEQMEKDISVLKESRDTSLQELENLKQDIENGVFTPEITAAKKEAEQLRQAQATILAEKDSLKQDYEKRIARLASELKGLQDSVDQEDTRVENLTAENSRLRTHQNIYWFCAGAAVFVSGIIAGKIMTRKKKRYMY